MLQMLRSEARWVFLGILLVMIGNGLQGSAVGLRSKIEGFSTLVTGLVMSANYAGLLAGSFVVPPIINRVRHGLANRIAAIGFAVSIPLLLLTNAPVAWVALRLGSGLFLSGLYITFESWINASSTSANRVGALSLYMATCYVGLSSGQLLLQAFSPAGNWVLITSAALITSSLSTMRQLGGASVQSSPRRMISLPALFRLSPLGTVGCFAVGASQGAYFGMGPTFTQLAGFEVRETSWYMAVGIVGAILTQLPIGFAASKIGRRRLLIISAAGAATVAVFAGAQLGGPPAGQVALIGVWGGLSMPIYSLVVAEANDQAAPSDMVGISGRFLLLYGLGAMSGPVLASLFITEFGLSGFYAFLATVNSLVVTIAVSERSLKRSRAA